MSKEKPRRALGIDYGMKRIGVALSDERQVLATALTTLPAARKTEQTVKQLSEAIKGWERDYGCVIDPIVVGLPLRLSGKAGLMADEVMEVVRLLGEVTDAEVLTWDERLSTVMAERVMREAGMSRKRRATVIDQNTAVVILQGYLDRQGSSYLPVEHEL